MNIESHVIIFNMKYNNLI